MKKIGVLTSGGDAPGMNAAIRSVVRSATSKGIEVCGILRGYNGLINGEFRAIGPRDVSHIMQTGGTVLYTARCDEFRYEEGLQKAKAQCINNGIEGIIVIGGDGSFRGAADFSARGVPCIGIPGTIDNDIAMTEYTIGFDTAMNTAMELIDKVRDTAASHDRCSIIEVMGHRAGYLALHCGVACGATCIVVSEIPMSEEDIINHIRVTRDNGKKNFVIVVSESVGNSMELATRIERETGIVSRATILGHVQRGGSPSAKDRVVATQMGHYAVDLLSHNIGNKCIGIQNNKLVDFDIQEALRMRKPFETDLYKIAVDVAI